MSNIISLFLLHTPRYSRLMLKLCCGEAVIVVLLYCIIHSLSSSIRRRVTGFDEAEASVEFESANFFGCIHTSRQCTRDHDKKRGPRGSLAETNSAATRRVIQENFSVRFEQLSGRAGGLN